MVKPLTFKGDKPKKRKRTAAAGEPAADSEAPASKALVQRPEGDDDAAVEDDTWVSAEVVTDIAGPAIILLPTTPLSCLATDAHGKVFASRIVNLAEDQPYATAEPHDVRQVWLTSRVAGSETFSLRGNNGRYLGCDGGGAVSAVPEAFGPEESWRVVPVAETRGAFALQTARDGFVAVGDAGDDEDVERTEIRGDAETITFGATLRIRMQARYKPRLKQGKEDRASSKISRRELEEAVGRRLEDDEVKALKRARRDGSYHETLLDIKVKGKHDKFA